MGCTAGYHPVRGHICKSVHVRMWLYYTCICHVHVLEGTYTCKRYVVDDIIYMLE